MTHVIRKHMRKEKQSMLRNMGTSVKALPLANKHFPIIISWFDSSLQRKNNSQSDLINLVNKWLK